MKKIFSIVLCLLTAAIVQAQFTKTTIKAIQEVHPDSLKFVDSIGYNVTANPPFWRKQASPMLGQKVEVVGLVTIPPYLATFTSGGRTLVISDTGAAAADPWTSILVIYGPDGTSTLSGGKWTGGTFDNNGYNAIKAGDIIQIKGTITEFPTPATVSLTQFAPDTNEAVIILSSGNPIPPAPLKKISDFNVGANPGGKINFIGGEPWESKQVMFTNLTITAAVNTLRGTWAFIDAAGNTLSMYDMSTHFTLATRNPGRDTTYFMPAIGTKIDTLRGYISTVSGGEANRGYRISPIYKTDVKYGFVLPGVTTHRRTPIVVAVDSTPVVSAKVFKQTGGVNLMNVKLVFKVDQGAWVETTMVAKQASIDSIYSVTLPKQAAGAVVNYFIRAIDSNRQATILASGSNTSSGQLTQLDTSKGTFFYKVLDRTAQPVLSIRDVQYTPFVNGMTPYLAAYDSVGGIITADTSSLLKVGRSQGGGTTVYYMQSTNQPWSGIWVVGPDSVMKTVLNGDSVVVKGTLTEFNGITEIFNVNNLRIVSRGNPLPAAVVLKTSQFGPSVANGNLGAEPYEGMLVRVDSVTVTSIDPVFQDPYQYEVSNSTAPMLVTRDGRNNYSNIETDSGSTILRIGNKLKSITGIIHYFNNRYKLVPRSNSDFGGFISSVSREDLIPESYSLYQNYPNPFNPATTIKYAIPADQFVTLKVYNVIGQEVATLVNSIQSAGTYSAQFDAAKLATGIYVYRLTAGNFVQTKKMLLVK